jgi:hypothetical protein
MVLITPPGLTPGLTFFIRLPGKLLVILSFIVRNTYFGLCPVSWNTAPKTLRISEGIYLFYANKMVDGTGGSFWVALGWWEVARGSNCVIRRLGFSAPTQK